MIVLTFKPINQSWKKLPKSLALWLMWCDIRRGWDKWLSIYGTLYLFNIFKLVKLVPDLMQ